MRKTTTLLLIITILSSCHYYKQYDKESFPTYVWKSGQEITFEPTIEDHTKSYRLTLGIRHLFGFEPSSIGIRVQSISPAGKEVTKDYEFQIRDGSNEYIGSCGGDLCDLETVVDDNFVFDEPGQYTFILTHIEDAAKIPGVMELGLILDPNE